MLPPVPVMTQTFPESLLDISALLVPRLRAVEGRWTLKTRVREGLLEPRGRLSSNITIAPIEVSRHHRMLVILRRGKPWRTLRSRPRSSATCRE